MGAIMDEIRLMPEQEKIKSEKAKKLARLRNLERQTRKEIEKIKSELSQEEVQMVEDTFSEEDTQIDDVPEYLSVSEVAAITGLSPQIIRRHCSNGKFQGYQPSGPNGIWYVKSDTFRKSPEFDWNEFISKRNEMFARSKKVANISLELQDEDLEEKEKNTDAETL